MFTLGLGLVAGDNMASAKEAKALFEEWTSLEEERSLLEDRIKEVKAELALLLDIGTIIGSKKEKKPKRQRKKGA